MGVLIQKWYNYYFKHNRENRDSKETIKQKFMVIKNTSPILKISQIQLLLLLIQ